MNSIRNGHGPEWESKIALYAGGDLPPAEALELERHLASCSECRGAIEGFAGVLDASQEMHREPLPPAAYSTVRARVLAELERPVPFWRRAWVYAVPGAVAALVLLTVPSAWRKPLSAPTAEPRTGTARVSPLKREAPATSAPESAALVVQAPGLRAGPPAGANLPRNRQFAAQTAQPKATEPSVPEPPEQMAAANENRSTSEPLVIKMLTDDPDVIIYWIADSKGD